MNCPNCQFENREGAKFCGKCGHQFEITCPECGTKNQAENNFCDECGSKLSLPVEQVPKQISLDEKLAKIQKYLPKGLTEKILSQKDRIEGERKQVTVMFCDMEGFTALSEKLGIEEVYAIMDQVYEILIHKVHDYEGTVNEMTGDGIMALFGAPIALEDASQRAIRSAYAIHREMFRYSEKIKQEKSITTPIKMRIGIHTGPVVVGTLGNDLRVEFKAVGETVNLASRMEAMAEPGTIYVTDDTFRLTEGFFRFESLGEKKIKGKQTPVKAYRVIAPSTRRTRFEVSAERGLTPFIGREREHELLLDGFELSKAGKGQAFSIVAEAGIGKSRLLYEFRKAIANEDLTFLEGKCLSYSRGVAYYPVIDILKSNFDINETDSDVKITQKVKKGLKILSVDETSTLPYFLELLSVKESGIDQIPMSPEGKKDRINEALKRIVVKGSEIRPLVMAFEDLHWMDKSSEDVMKGLLESISGAKVVLVFTYRPEFVPTWGARSYHNQVNLNRLSNRESLLMVSYLLGTEELDNDLENLILEKTEGIPFFIEEFIKSLNNLNLIEKKGNRSHLKEGISTLSIPSTIQDVILARVDSLPQKAREVLQAGSVIEREFTYELIKRVTGIPEQELLSLMAVLKDSELLYERGLYPESTYIFKHALTHELIYSSILTKRKKELHCIVGKSIEDIYKENISEYYGVLVGHFIEGEYYEKAAEYSKLASRKALKTAAINDSIEYTKKIILSLEKLPQTHEVQRLIIDARTKLGLNLLELNYFHEANESIEPIIKTALKINYEKRIPQIYTVIGSGRFCIEENFQEAFDYLETALRVCEKRKDIASSVYVNYWLGFALAANCEFERSLHHLEQVLNFHLKANNLSWVAVLKSLISYLVYYFKGDIDQAYQLSQEAVHTSEETGDIHSKLFAYSCYGACLYAKGTLNEAKIALLQGLEFSEKAKQLWWRIGCNLYLGDVYYYLGNYQKSQNYTIAAVNRLEKEKMYPSFLNLSKIYLVRAQVASNNVNIDLESLRSYASQSKFEFLNGWTKKSIAEILLFTGNEHLLEAEEWIVQSIKTDKKNGMMYQLGQDYAIYGEILKRIGESAKAAEKLRNAIDILVECGADGWVEKYEQELLKL
jgi:class 3 adenylate cyclase/tetratricopeptide (TPR) repeat protein